MYAGISPCLQIVATMQWKTRWWCEISRFRQRSARVVLAVNWRATEHRAKQSVPLIPASWQGIHLWTHKCVVLCLKFLFILYVVLWVCVWLTMSLCVCLELRVETNISLLVLLALCSVYIENVARQYFADARSAFFSRMMCMCTSTYIFSAHNVRSGEYAAYAEKQ